MRIDARAAAEIPPLPGLPGGGLTDRPELTDELIDELLGGARTAQEIAGPDGLLGQLTRWLLERALEAEMDHPEFDGDRVTWLSISRNEIQRGREIYRTGDRIVLRSLKLRGRDIVEA